MKESTQDRLNYIISLSERYIKLGSVMDRAKASDDFHHIISICKNALHEDPVESEG